MSRKDRLELENVAFIGRTYREYMDMFGLDESLLRGGPALDCPAGPSSFAAEAYARGFKVVACDILYNLPADDLAAKGERDLALIGRQMDDVAHLYRWDYYGDKAGLMERRAAALKQFLADFPAGEDEGRYIHAELPRLPFADGSFRLVLSSHFLFLYGDRFGPDFHAESLLEMARVSSGEVRIYPLQGLDSRPCPHMHKVLDILRGRGVAAEIRPTPFEFLKGADRMLFLGPGVFIRQAFKTLDICYNSNNDCD